MKRLARSPFILLIIGAIVSPCAAPVTVGALGEAYVLGRAFTAAERDKALAVVRNTSGVTNVVDYVEVRPKEG
jgi:hypothetical protein